MDKVIETSRKPRNITDNIQNRGGTSLINRATSTAISEGVRLVRLRRIEVYAWCSLVWHLSRDEEDRVTERACRYGLSV